MNYRAEIDALPKLSAKRHYEGTDEYVGIEYVEALQDKLALAARIHAEPHSRLCLDNMADCQWIGEQVKCTCGKDDALAEVLG